MNAGVLRGLIKRSGGVVDDAVFGHSLSGGSLDKIIGNNGKMINPSLMASRLDPNNFAHKRFGDIFLTGDPELINPMRKGVRAFDRDIFSGTVPEYIEEGANKFYLDPKIRELYGNNPTIDDLSSFMSEKTQKIGSGLDYGNIDALSAGAFSELNTLEDIGRALSRKQDPSRYEYIRDEAKNFADSVYRDYGLALDDYNKYLQDPSSSMLNSTGGSYGKNQYLELMGGGSTPYAEIKHNSPLDISDFSTAYVGSGTSRSHLDYLRSAGLNVIPYDYRGLMRALMGK